MNILQAALEATDGKTPITGEGVEVDFYKMDWQGREVGIKVFRRKLRNGVSGVFRGSYERVQQIRETQNTLHEWGLAPAVLSDVHQNYNGLWFFVTELADMSGRPKLKTTGFSESVGCSRPDFDEDDRDDYWAWCDLEYEYMHSGEYYTKRRNMEDDLQTLFELGIIESGPDDMHEENIGLNPENGELWLIDMGCVQNEVIPM